MSSFHSVSLSLLCAASLARAQTAPAPASSAHSHTPAASSHAHGVVTLDQFVTSAAPFSRNQVDLAQSTTVLSGRALQLKQQPSLGETLAAETGMHATSFGPGASRPIIRGLGGDRIRLLENSVGTLDASVASPDHAVSVEPFLVERIEVVRGPASLLYGSNAVGGVVNVITHRIETDLPTETVRGAVDLRFNSASDEFSRGGVLDVALKPSANRAVVLHLDGFRRDADNLRIPGFAESARVRAEETEHALEHGEPAPEFARGRLPNSSLDSRSGAAGLSYVTEHFHFGASYSGLDSFYGVPGHAHESSGPALYEGIRIDLRQRRTDVQGEWHDDTGFLRGARFKFGHARYRHSEIEPDGTIGTVFANRGHDARFEALHGDGKPLSGAFGLQSSRSDFEAIGEEAFLPPSRTDNHALFAFQEIAGEPLTWQFGARYERTRLASPGRGSRREDEIAGSLGALWKLDPIHTLALSVSHSGRPPGAQELFAEGPHSGTQTFEVGDVTLRPERSLNLEASLRRRQGFVTGAATLFANQFDGYIFASPTGLDAVADDDEWAFVPSGTDLAGGDPDAERLPVFGYVQRDARFWGAEVETVWHLHERDHSQFDLRLAADFTRARAAGRNLPRIPAARFTLGLAWAGETWSAGADCQFVLAQKRVAPDETTSPDYTLVGAHVTRRFTLGHAEFELFLRGTNLTAAEARPHPSFVKELAPLAGRAASAGVRLTF